MFRPKYSYSEMSEVVDNHKTNTKKSMIVSPTFETRCFAFTMDHRRCRLQRVFGTPTCEIHSKYFDNWTSSHPYLINKAEPISKRILNEYESGLRLLDASTLMNYVANIPQLVSYSQFYNFLISLDIVDPLMNGFLFRDAMRTCIINEFHVNNVDSAYHILIDVKSTYKVTFDKLMRNVSQLTYGLLFTIQCTLEFMINDLDAIPLTITGDLYTSLLEKITDYYKETVYELLSWNKWSELMYSDFIRHIINFEFMNNGRREELGRSLFKTIIQPTLNEIKSTWVATRRSICDTYKEELMMAAWHPGRVQKMLESGTDFEEM